MWKLLAEQDTGRGVTMDPIAYFELDFKPNVALVSVVHDMTTIEAVTAVGEGRGGS